jgi:prepilin-type processing-associated H-X9-DG protein
MVTCQATSQTFLFCDAAGVGSTLYDALPLGEVDTFVAPFIVALGPPFNYPTTPAPYTHFRHGAQLANVSFLDGHVETRSQVAYPNPSTWTAAQNATATQYGIGYLDNNVPPTFSPYIGQ